MLSAVGQRGRSGPPGRAWSDLQLEPSIDVMALKGNPPDNCRDGARVVWGVYIRLDVSPKCLGDQLQKEEKLKLDFMQLGLGDYVI